MSSSTLVEVRVPLSPTGFLATIVAGGLATIHPDIPGIGESHKVFIGFFFITKDMT